MSLEEQEQLQALLAKQRQRLVPQPRTVRICGVETRYLPLTGARALELAQSAGRAEVLLAALKAAFPDLDREYGVENLGVAALRQCLVVLTQDLEVGQDKLPQ